MGARVGVSEGKADEVWVVVCGKRAGGGRAVGEESGERDGLDTLGLELGLVRVRVRARVRARVRTRARVRVRGRGRGRGRVRVRVRAA